MVSTWILAKLAYIVISIVAGMILFYVTSQNTFDLRKQQMEESVSLIINFILFIWAAKIILNMTIFVTDPLAVLAYPSNANTFYLALLFLAVNLIYKRKRRHADLNFILAALVPIFLGSAFVYEFIEVTVRDNMMDLGHLGLLLVLLIGFLVVRERQTIPVITSFVFIAWSAGLLFLTWFLPYTKLYGYMLKVWFLITVLVISLLSLYISKKK